MVVVVLGKAGEGDFGFDQVGKALAVQDLALEHRPKASILPLVQGVLI
jgi:hypothetical protein